jgi:hypothetical protein
MVPFHYGLRMERNRRLIIQQDEMYSLIMEMDVHHQKEEGCKSLHAEVKSIFEIRNER